MAAKYGAGAACVSADSAVAPCEENRVLKPQTRRAAISVSSNIAEGHARRGHREFARAVSHAQGSLAELQTQLQITVDLGYVRRQQLGPMLNEITQLAKMLNATRTNLLKRKLVSNL